MTQVKCPCCLMKQEPREPSGGWEGEQNDVKCRFCNYVFTVICEVTYEVQGDFDLFSFMDLFDLKNLPDGIAKDIFHRALHCIKNDYQKELKDGYENPSTKDAFEFAIIHYQRIRRMYEKKKPEVKTA